MKKQAISEKEPHHPKGGIKKLLIKLSAGVLGLVLGGLAGIILAMVVVFLGFLLLAILYFLGIFMPISAISNMISFMQNFSVSSIFNILTITMAILGAIGLSIGAGSDFGIPNLFNYFRSR